MVTLEASPSSRASRCVDVRPTGARVMRVAMLLVSATAFVFVGTPTAAADPALTSNHIRSTWDPPPPCRGEKPGFCPDTPFVQSRQPLGA
jgi:hypothetical protein